MRKNTMMATSLEQSKKLIALGVDKSTADMMWLKLGDGKYKLELRVKELEEFLHDGDMIAWSVSRLMELIPGCSLNRIDDEETGAVRWYCNTMRFGTNHFSYDGGYYGTQIEALIEAIEWLSKNGQIEVFKEFTPKEIKEDVDRLYDEIDECISKVVKAKKEQNKEEIGKSHFNMETLMVKTQQLLTNVSDFLGKEE